MVLCAVCWRRKDKTIVTMAGIGENGRRFTNHSIRKTTVRKRQKAGVSNDKIASITGHKKKKKKV